jgi:F0F1-type ATP synthase assembly protein I
MQEKGGFKTWYAFSLAWQLGFIIAFSIAGFMFLGFLGDQFLGSAPYLLILGIFLGVVVTIYEVHNLISPLIHNKNEHRA